MEETIAKVEEGSVVLNEDIKIENGEVKPELTPDEKRADIKVREELIRSGIEALIKEHQITIDAQLQFTTKGIIPGIVLVDLKFNEGITEHI